MEAVLNILGRQTTWHIGEPSEIAAARRAGNELGRALGMDEVRTGEVALLITEAATNIVKHAEHGEILLRPVHRGEVPGIEILAIDSGPGMDNVGARMQDGNSTAGTYGVGLGTIRRLAHEFDIYSYPGTGTALVMTLWRDPAKQAALPARWQTGAVSLPMPGEDECGDGWQMVQDGAALILMVSDGLGHGPEAARASKAATQVALGHAAEFPGQMMQSAHAALRGSRGAALAILRIDTDDTLRFAGIGNIAACVFEPQARRHLLSHNGIVGSNMRKVQEFAQPWVAGSAIVMHSDGIGTRWDLQQYPGLEDRHPALIAAVLYRDFTRGRDDVTVVVVREQGSAP
jgi:anti-sigma regulatory factor (Ser/Thr protein kinase)